MRRLKELTLRSVRRRPRPLFSASAMLLLVAVTLGGSDQLPRPLGTMFFTSYADFTGRLARHTMPAGVRAVAYDPELWRA